MTRARFLLIRDLLAAIIPLVVVGYGFGVLV